MMIKCERSGFLALEGYIEGVEALLGGSDFLLFFLVGWFDYEMELIGFEGAGSEM